MHTLRDFENRIAVSAAACNWGCGWDEEPRCERCGTDLTYKEQYRNVYGDLVCEKCFEEDFGEDEE